MVLPMNKYWSWIFNVISKSIKEMWYELPIRYAFLFGSLSLILIFICVPFEYVPLGIFGAFIMTAIGMSYGIYKDENPVGE